MFDLKKQKLSKLAEVGYEFEVLVPETFEPTGIFITVRGKESDVVKNFGRRKFQEMQQREARAARTGRKEDMTLEQAEELAVESAVVRVMSWKGVFEDGVAVEFNEDNVERIMLEHAWIREQVIEESDNLSNFLK